MSGNIPPIDVGVGEGSKMVYYMATQTHWNFAWAHNVAYNPIPVIAFIQASLSKALGVPWYSWYLGMTVFLWWVLAYDIAVYLLTKYLTNDERAALLAVPLAAITPEASINQNPYHWSSTMLILLALALLIRFLKGYDARIPSLFIAVTLLYTGAILDLLTALALNFIVAALFLIPLVATPILVKLRMDIIGISKRDTLILFALTVVLFVIFTIRAVATPGIMEHEISPLINAFISLFKKFAYIFFLSVADPSSSTFSYVPLYVRAGVSPLQAYVWAFVLAVATAYIIYAVIVKRRVDMLHVSLYLTTITAVILIYIEYGILHNPSFYLFNEPSYTFLPFIYPVAAIALSLTMRSIRHSNKVLKAVGLISLALFIITAPLAARDPNISPIDYALAHKTPIITITPGDMIKAQIIIDHTTPNQNLIVYSQKNYIQQIVYTSQGFRTEYILINKLISAINLFTYINGMQAPQITAINSTNINYDIVFDFGKELLLQR
ncbi:hypothetical protein [Thermoproteus tenax]|nr:hypothetical protein [Thermoproteus tenax]